VTNFLTGRGRKRPARFVVAMTVTVLAAALATKT
jgi:hypothetical protein